MAFSIAGANILQKKKKCGKGPVGMGFWPFLDPWDVVGFAHNIQRLECPGKYGPHGELFFFVIKKKPDALTKAVEFRLFVPAETLKHVH